MHSNNPCTLAVRFLVVLMLASCAAQPPESSFRSLLPTGVPVPSESVAQGAGSATTTSMALPAPAAASAPTGTPASTKTLTPTNAPLPTVTPQATNRPAPTLPFAPQQTVTTVGPPSTAPGPAQKSVVVPPDLPPQLAGWPDDLLKLINEQRAAYKVPALTLSPELASAAQAHAEDCARRNWGSHVGSDGAILLTRLARAGYAARAASENWANARTVQATFSAWWNEPPGNDIHRRSIVDPRYKEVGIGIAPGGWGYYFVADFGSR